MDTSEKYALLNLMGKCEASPGLSSDQTQKYCAVFKIWSGRILVPYTWTYGETVDSSIDTMWEEIGNELWIFVTQIEAGH